jgi:hypothetical protein
VLAGRAHDAEAFLDLALWRAAVAGAVVAVVAFLASFQHSVAADRHLTA